MIERIGDRLVSAQEEEEGMTTAEYAVGTVGACGFAGVLVRLLTSDWAQGLLTDLFDKVWGVLTF